MSRHHLAAILLIFPLAQVGCGDDASGPSDSGVADAVVPVDGSPTCENDDQCGDGVYCNGEEICSEGVCVYGPRRTCDDGVVCTLDSCSESANACRHEVPDEDGDGHGDINCTDNDGEALGDDCDDTRASRYPGNREVCDPANVDEDCDDRTYGSLDQDDDGFDSNRCCNAAADDATELTCGSDCNDNRASVHPEAAELCDKIDNDCDVSVDEDAKVMLYVDADRDGHGLSGSVAVAACAGSVGFSSDDIDCDDRRATVHGAQVEICDTIDNDCDLDVDEEENAVAWYVDDDGDGFGTQQQPSIASCTPPEGYSILRSDCNDTVAAINPAAAELCDGLDNDCSGSPDALAGPNNLEDDDGDGSPDVACGSLGTDCDDDNPNTGSGVEICDGYDNDCDDKIDEEVPNTVWYLDSDGDGFGDTSKPAVVLCAPISGRTPFGGDCNDMDPLVSPKATEICNGRDDNCDGVVDSTAELIDAGCVGGSVTVTGKVFGPQGGASPGLRAQGIGSSARPNKPQGTASITAISGARITVLHHTGSIVGTATTNSSGTFTLRVPRGTLFVIAEPPSNRAADLVGSAIPITGPRSDLEIQLHLPSDLSSLAPTSLTTRGVILANITGASHSGGQGIVIDPSVPTASMVGIAVQSGNTLPPYNTNTWIRDPAIDPLPFTTVSAVDVLPGGYSITALDPNVCSLVEGNFFANNAIWAQSWPVRANVITWVPVDCSPGLGDSANGSNCCEPHFGGGCANTGVSDCVTAINSGCTGSWDETCVHQVSVLGCSSCPSASSCFTAHPGRGCDEIPISQCVCQSSPSCCTDTWSASCVGFAVSCAQFTGQSPGL